MFFDLLTHCFINLQLSVAIKQPSGTDYTLELDLAHEIDQTKVEKKIYSTKVVH